MKTRAFRMAQVLGIAASLTILEGCETTQERARQQATKRWNIARAEIKVKLASDQFAAGNVAAAADELAEASRLNPEHQEFVPLQARIWLAQGKLAAATELLEQSRLNGGSQPETEYLLGIARQQQQRWHDALASFLRAAELDTDEVAYVVAAAQTWLQLGEPLEALALLTDRVSRFGWTNAYQAALAECHEQTGNWTAAASAWQRVAAAAPNDLEVQNRLAAALYGAERYSEASDVLQQVLDQGQSPSTNRWRLMLAKCLLMDARSDAARTHVQDVLHDEPDNVRALRLLARCWGEAGEYSVALRAVRQALAIDETDAETLELAAGLAWRAGERPAARALARQLVNHDPGNAVARHILQASGS